MSFLEVLLFCLAAMTRGGVCDIGGCFRVPPRLIIVTDESLLDNDELSDTEEDPTIPTLQYLGTRSMRENVISQIIVVPLGESVKMYMENYITQCKGRFLTDITGACNYQRMKIMTAQIIQHLTNEIEPGKTETSLDICVSAASGDCTLKEKCHVSDIVRAKLNIPGSYLGATHVFDNLHVTSSLPPVGSRVIRGPDWKWGKQGIDGTGTIFNHGGDKKSLWILWDCGQKNVYRYGLKDFYDVLLVDDRPRLKDGSIEIGMKVGKDDMDAHGTVIRKAGETVLTLWPDGSLEEHIVYELYKI